MLTPTTSLLSTPYQLENREWSHSPPHPDPWLAALSLGFLEVPGLAPVEAETQLLFLQQLRTEILSPLQAGPLLF